MPRIRVEQLSFDAVLPERATSGSAGYDLHAYIPADSSVESIGVGHDGPLPPKLKVAIESYGQQLIQASRMDIAGRITGQGSQSFPSIYVPLEPPSAEARLFHSNGVVELPPGHRALIPTGLKLAIPDGWECQIRPRSGKAIKEGLTVLNAPATIDSDFRGELKVLLYNAGAISIRIHHQDRIAQLLAFPTFEIRFELGDVSNDTVRGDGGFGSTGT